MRSVQHLHRLLTEIGYVATTPITTEFSTMGQIGNAYRKGSKHFTYGLGEQGLPPMILHPNKMIIEEIRGDEVWMREMSQQELNNYYDSLTDDEFKNVLK